VDAIEEREGYVLLHVRVQPRASRNAVILEPDGRIRAAISAPPIEGAANKALCEMLAKALGLPKRAVSLAAGDKGREKTVQIEGIPASEVLSRLKGQ